MARRTTARLWTGAPQAGAVMMAWPYAASASRSRPASAWAFPAAKARAAAEVTVGAVSASTRARASAASGASPARAVYRQYAASASVGRPSSSSVRARWYFTSGDAGSRPSARRSRSRAAALSPRIAACVAAAASRSASWRWAREARAGVASGCAGQPSHIPGVSRRRVSVWPEADAAETSRHAASRTVLRVIGYLCRPAGTGRAWLVREPSPSCPARLNPQHDPLPDAPATVPHVWAPLACSDAKREAAATATGRGRS
jgi:hypothetical protein